jgi:hypothetical protein
MTSITPTRPRDADGHELRAGDAVRLINLDHQPAGRITGILDHERVSILGHGPTPAHHVRLLKRDDPLHRNAAPLDQDGHPTADPWPRRPHDLEPAEPLPDAPPAPWYTAPDALAQATNALGTLHHQAFERLDRLDQRLAWLVERQHHADVATRGQATDAEAAAEQSGVNSEAIEALEERVAALEDATAGGTMRAIVERVRHLERITPAPNHDCPCPFCDGDHRDDLERQADAERRRSLADHRSRIAP